MRIVDTNQAGNSSPAQTGRTGATRPVDSTGSKNSGSGKVSQSGDSVQLSGFSGKVSQSLQTDASARAQKVAQVAAAVKSGTYKVDAQAVSRAIVDHAIAGGVDKDGDGK
jgi:flagellar biosynthesis anti-sigma factor FlgM